MGGIKKSHLASKRHSLVFKKKISIQILHFVLFVLKCLIDFANIYPFYFVNSLYVLDKICDAFKTQFSLSRGNSPPVTQIAELSFIKKKVSKGKILTVFITVPAPTHLPESICKKLLKLVEKFGEKSKEVLPKLEQIYLQVLNHDHFI